MRGVHWFTNSCHCISNNGKTPPHTHKNQQPTIPLFALHDEGQTLKTSAFQIFHDGNLTFSNSSDKTKFSCFTLPATQHHSFFRHYKFAALHTTGNASVMQGPFLKNPKNFRGRKAIHKTSTRLFWKASRFICCKGDKK